MICGQFDFGGTLIVDFFDMFMAVGLAVRDELFDAPRGL